MSLAAEYALSDTTRCLPKMPAFDEATARVDEALDALRAAEESLERQLADLRRYLNEGGRNAVTLAAVA